MANDKGYYTAWDGKRYVGQPPSGWFLAADNRWWPAPDQGADDESTDRNRPLSMPSEESETASTSADPALGTAEPVDAADGTPDPPEPAPPASWAPMANDQRRAESEPVAAVGHNRPPATSPPVQRTRQRRWNRGGFRRRLVPLVFLFFLLSRCGLFDNDSTVDLDQFGPNATLAEPAAEDYSVRDGCSPTFLWGSITNESARTMTFVARTIRTDGGTVYDSEATTIAAGAMRSWSIPFSPSDEPPDFCPPVQILEVIPG